MSQSRAGEPERGLGAASGGPGRGADGVKGEAGPTSAGTAYAVFLRGVNVGGVKVTSDALRAMLAEMPLTGVRTLLATGNVVCRFEGDGVALRVLMEAALRETFDRDLKVVVLSATRLRALLDACPYPSDDPTAHTYVTVTSAPDVLDDLSGAVADADPAEQSTRLGPEAVAWLAPVGGTLATARSKIAGRARFRESVTDRNLRTMIKVRAALDELESGGA